MTDIIFIHILSEDSVYYGNPSRDVQVTRNLEEEDLDKNYIITVV